MTRHVVVVGAGIIGACCAGWLQRKGFKVTLVDRADPGEATSSGNAGALAPTAVLPVAMRGMYKQIPKWLLDPLGPLSVRWSYLPSAMPWLVRFLRRANDEDMWRTVRAMRGLLTPLFDCYMPLVRNAHAEHLIRKDGGVYVYESQAAFDGDRYIQDLRRRAGATLEVLGEAEIHELEPSLAPKFKWGIYAPDNGLTTDPKQLTKAIARQVVADGGRCLRADVLAIETDAEGRKTVRTAEGKEECDAVVVAAGAWSRKLASALGDDVPLESQRGYHVTLADPGIPMKHSVNWVGRRAFATPMDMGLRLAGTVEIAGLDAPPNWPRADILVGVAKEMYPDLNVSKVSRWMGHRPCLPDSLPVIGPSAHVPGVYYAFGHGHVGMSGAASTGRTISELVAGEPPQVDVQPFRVDRF